VGTKNGFIVLPKECTEFVLNLPVIYSVQIRSGSIIPSKILDDVGITTETEETKSIQGFKRGSFWDLVVATISAGEPGKVNLCGKPGPILTDAENFLAVSVRTVGGVPTDGVLTGMWR
jgi:hypothetical protein